MGQFSNLVALLALLILSISPAPLAIRFVIDREECFSHNVEYEGDTVHVSFVVIKADAPWHYGDDGVDLVIKGPGGDQIHDFRDKTSEKAFYSIDGSKLEEALYNIQFEQHWLEAQTDRQAIVNEGMSKKAVHKAIFESLALIGASFLQVYLLRRLFERKLGMSRV
ncbi:hypothetical protein QQ045_006540 [Rhodiola kirilowii]